MKWRKKVSNRKSDDLFFDQHRTAMESIKESTEVFVSKINEFVSELNESRDLEKEIIDLRARIEHLESVIMPLRNGAVAH